jgi:hypothetical protein
VSSRRVSIARVGGLTIAEEEFAQWAEGRGLVTVFDTVWPPDDEPGDPFDVRALCREALCDDGRHHVQCIDVGDPSLSMGEPAWKQIEDLLTHAWRVHLSEAGVEEVDST